MSALLIQYFSIKDYGLYGYLFASSQDINYACRVNER